MEAMMMWYTWALNWEALTVGPLTGAGYGKRIPVTLSIKED